MCFHLVVWEDNPHQLDRYGEGRYNLGGVQGIDAIPHSLSFHQCDVAPRLFHDFYHFIIDAMTHGISLWSAMRTHDYESFGFDKFNQITSTSKPKCVVVCWSMYHRCDDRRITCVLVGAHCTHTHTCCQTQSNLMNQFDSTSKPKRFVVYWVKGTRCQMTE
jgi:hypothetical protein